MTLLLALLVAAPARASSIYPSDVQSALDMDCAPTCMLCHATNSGGGGTVTQAFGQAAMDAGLTGGANSELLAQVLTDLETSGSDVDGDGTTDIEALAAGLNPNGGDAFCAADGGEAAPTPTYGCLDTGGRHTAGAGFAALLLTAGAVLVRRVRSAAAS
jgi:hypothetical protein